MPETILGDYAFCVVPALGGFIFGRLHIYCVGVYIFGGVVVLHCDCCSSVVGA